MNERLPYAMNMDVKFDVCEMIDMPSLMNFVEDHWHKHVEEDGFFYCVEGIFVVETEDEIFRLEPKAKP